MKTEDFNLKLVIESIMMAALDELNLPHNGSDRDNYQKYSLTDREESAIQAAELSVGILLDRICRVSINESSRAFLPFRQVCFDLVLKSWEKDNPQELYRKIEDCYRRNEFPSDKEFFDRELPGIYPDVSSLADGVLKSVGIRID